MELKNLLQQIEAERRLNEMASLPYIIDGNCVCFYYSVNRLPSKEDVQVKVNRAIVINEISSHIVDLSLNFALKIIAEDYEDEDDYFEYFANLISSNSCNVSTKAQWEVMGKYIPQGLMQVYVEVSNKILGR